MYRRIPLALTLVFLVTTPAPAVIVPYGSGRNLDPPTGALANAGWQWQAEFSGFLGTPISSKWFITAQHIGGGIGGSVHYNGLNTFTDAAVDIPGTDLRLWRITDTFPTWAPMWNPQTDGSSLFNRRLFVVGRGTQRGEPIFAPNNSNAVPNGEPGQTAGGIEYGQALPPGYEIRGWKWGHDDRARSWGENVVRDVIDGGPSLGPLLYFTFDNPGLLNEAALSAGDSGGAVFVRNNAGQYKLAGINFGVDGPFRETPTSPGYFAAMFDIGGFYANDPPQFILPRTFNQPSGAYASSVVAHLAFINGVIAGTESVASIPEPASAALVLATGVMLRRRR